jgi:hypothetical protein
VLAECESNRAEGEECRYASRYQGASDKWSMGMYDSLCLLPLLVLLALRNELLYMWVEQDRRNGLYRDCFIGQ